MTTIFLIGLGASFFGSFVSGSLSALVLPLLILLGMPAHVALGTFRLGVFGFEIGGLIQYIKNNKVIWKFVPILTIVAAAGGLLGSLIAVNLEEEVISTGIGVLLLIFIPFTLLRPTLGLIRKETSRQRTLLGYGVYFLVSVYGLSLTIGYGLIAAMVYMYFFGLTVIESKATGKLPTIMQSVAALAVFGFSGVVDWVLGFVLLAGMLIGSSIGTKYVIKLGNVWMRNILLVTIGLFSLKLIFGF